MVKPQNPTTTSPFKRREQKSNKKPKIILGNPNSYVIIIEKVCYINEFQMGLRCIKTNIGN